MIMFTIPGAPAGKGRPRATNRGKHIAMYTDEKTASYENKVALFASQAMEGKPPSSAPFSIDMRIYSAPPESWSGKRKAMALRGEIVPTKKPDIDNVEKIIFDAMNGIVWADDVQVIRVSKEKMYSDTPRVVVVATPLDVVGA